MFYYYIQVLKTLYLVENTLDKIYVKLDSNVPYIDKKMSTNNVWNYYFYQPFDITHDEFITSELIEGDWFQNDMKIGPGYHLLDVETLKIARTLTKKYIKIKEPILEKVNIFLKNNTNIADSILSVHKRGTDHIEDKRFAHLLDIGVYYNEIDKRIDNYDKLLACSDEQFSIDAFKRRYGKKVIAYDSIRALTPQNEGVHYSLVKHNPYKTGEDVVIECILMSKSNFLIKTIRQSNVAYSSLFLNENLKFFNIE